jgi:hypothetical protein
MHMSMAEQQIQPISVQQIQHIAEQQVQPKVDEWAN